MCEVGDWKYRAIRLSKTLAASLGSAQFIENFLQSLSVSPVNNTLTEV